MKHVDCFTITLFESYSNFCCSPVHFAIERICVRAPTAPYIVHLLKVHCHYMYVSLGNLYKNCVGCSSIALFKSFSQYLRS